MSNPCAWNLQVHNYMYLRISSLIQTFFRNSKSLFLSMHSLATIKGFLRLFLLKAEEKRVRRSADEPIENIAIICLCALNNNVWWPSFFLFFGSFFFCQSRNFVPPPPQKSVKLLPTDLVRFIQALHSNVIKNRKYNLDTFKILNCFCTF